MADIVPLPAGTAPDAPGPGPHPLPLPEGEGAERKAEFPEFRISAAAILDAARAAEREEVLAEIAQLRGEKSGWFSKLLVLAGTFALFIMLGVLGSNPLEWLLIVAAVIVVHEAGHYLGMILFGYRDVRMFFIPLFGAAVSGRSGSAPGWKRAVVALLGPLPGLFVGAAGAIICGPGNPVLLHFAWAFLLLNGTNLLPIYPLDGGRLVQDVLFSRNRFMDAAFKVASGLLFAGLGLLLLLGNNRNGWMLIAFALVAVVGVPSALQFGRMLERLRPELGELAADRAGSEEIPPEAIDRLIAEVRRENPRLPDIRAVAWRVETLWDRLQVRPPDWSASVAFLMIQFLGLLLGVAAALQMWRAARGGG
jgi:Zn-dependent protease